MITTRSYLTDELVVTIANAHHSRHSSKHLASTWNAGLIQTAQLVCDHVEVVMIKTVSKRLPSFERVELI